MVCTQPLRPASFQACEPVANAVGGSDQVHRVEQFVGHRRGRLHLLAGEEQILDAHGGRFVAEPLREVVVEVLAARAHAADVERHAALHGHARLLGLVGHDHADAGHDGEVREALAAACGREALFEIRQIRDVELLGVQHHREHAVGDLGRAAQARPG